MKVLVAVASRHGSTREIAQTIAEELQAAGLEVDLCDVNTVETVEPYTAVVLGSAVYMGNWLSVARTFVEQRQEQLRAVPVWLFSSGPIGAEDPKPHGDPPKLPELLDATHARGHHVFVGRLDPHLLGFGERLIAKAVHAPAGDFRDWDDVRAWARSIAAALAVPQP